MLFKQEKKIATALIALEETLKTRYGFSTYENDLFMNDDCRMLWCGKRLSELLPKAAMESLNCELPSAILSHGYVCSDTSFDDYRLHFFGYCSSKDDDEISLEVFLGLASMDVSVDMTVDKDNLHTPQGLIERANRRCDGFVLFYHETFNYSVETAFHPFVAEAENLVDKLMSPDLLVSYLAETFVVGIQDDDLEHYFECNNVVFGTTWAHVDEFLFYFATDYDKEDVHGHLNCPNLREKIPFIGVRNREDAYDITDIGAIAQFAVLLKDYLPACFIKKTDEMYADLLARLGVDTIGKMRLVVNFEAGLPDALTLQYGFAYPETEYGFIDFDSDSYKDFKKAWSLNSEECDPWSYDVKTIFDQEIVKAAGAVPETDENFPGRVRYMYRDYEAPLMTPGIPSPINEAVKPYLEKALAEEAVEAALLSFLAEYRNA